MPGCHNLWLTSRFVPKALPRSAYVEILPFFWDKNDAFFSFSRQRTLFSEFLWTTLPAVTCFVLQLNLYLLLSVVCILAHIPCVLLLCACQAAMCNCTIVLLCNFVILSYCVTVLLCYCATVLLLCACQGAMCNCATVCYYVTVLLCCCSVPAWLLNRWSTLKKRLALPCTTKLTGFKIS